MFFIYIVFLLISSLFNLIFRLTKGSSNFKSFNLKWFKIIKKPDKHFSCDFRECIVLRVKTLTRAFISAVWSMTQMFSAYFSTFFKQGFISVVPTGAASAKSCSCHMKRRFFKLRTEAKQFFQCNIFSLLNLFLFQLQFIYLVGFKIQKLLN